MSNQRQKLASLFAEYASDETAYFEYNTMHAWEETNNTPNINSDLSKYRIVIPYRREVKEAFKNGSEIEYQSKANGKWGLTIKPRWNWGNFDYRIKKPKEPFSTFAVITKNESIAETNKSKRYCENTVAKHVGWRVVKLVEEIE